MNETSQEYVGSTTRNVNCYSNIPTYGAKGMTNVILPPTPATVNPAMFDPMFYYLKSHAPPNQKAAVGNNRPGQPTRVHYSYVPDCKKDAPYATMKNMCNGEMMRGPTK